MTKRALKDGKRQKVRERRYQRNCMGAEPFGSAISCMSQEEYAEKVEEAQEEGHQTLDKWGFREPEGGGTDTAEDAKRLILNNRRRIVLAGQSDLTTDMETQGVNSMRDVTALRNSLSRLGGLGGQRRSVIQPVQVLFLQMLSDAHTL